MYLSLCQFIFICIISTVHRLSSNSSFISLQLLGLVTYMYCTFAFTLTCAHRCHYRKCKIIYHVDTLNILCFILDGILMSGSELRCKENLRLLTEIYYTK